MPSQDLIINPCLFEDIIIERGSGVYCYDTMGKEYLDFAAGIGVASLGHAHPKVLEVMHSQAAQLISCHAYFTTEAKNKAAMSLVEAGCFDKVFFCNSGTEAVEAALKSARKYAYEHKGTDCSQIISFRKSFHGRTYGAASVTEKRLAHPFFEPYLPNVNFATFNDIDSVKALINNKTAAVIVEPVQGESGVTPATSAFLKELRALCDAHNVCLIFDEVQSGMGRLGTVYAYQSYGVEPDIACWAKGIAAGFPVGIMAARGVYADALGYGTHGSTFGGSPLACALISCAFEEISAPAFLENVLSVSSVLMEGLRKVPSITDVRGRGLMIGFDTDFDQSALFHALQDNGLLVTKAGTKTIRLLPPLILQEHEARKGVSIIEKTLKDMV